MTSKPTTNIPALDRVLEWPEGAKPARFVDVTPTWSGLVPLIVAGLRDGTDKGRAAAESELRRLARFADEMNAEAKVESAAADLLVELKRWHAYALSNGWTDADFHDADGTGWISSTEAAISKAGAL